MEHAPAGRAHAPEAPRAERAPARSAATPAGAPTAIPMQGRGGTLLDLQRLAGNRAVADIVGATAQRVQVDASTSETLYNDETAATGQATPGNFSVSGSYELTRQGDTGVTVAVRIRFMSQSRTTTPPTPPATKPRLGQLVGKVTEIPGGDPRRTWATDMMTQAVRHWNGRLTFVGVERNITRANTTKRLPVTFQAIPVFTEGEAANSTVIIHPSTSLGGSPGHPIDAGNFYERRNANVYPASEDIIYAHEYGHLLGIPDEYSQSNRQMHLLLHQSSPAGAATARAALDRTTVERMVLAALARPLNARLTASLPGVVAALQAQQPMLTTKMATAARTGVRDPGVATELRTRLEQSSEASLHPSVPSIAAFQTTTNFSPRTRATEGVAAEFASPALTSRIGDAYWSALLAPHEQNTAVAGLGDVAVIPATSAYGMGQGTGPVAAPAAGLATTAVGPAPAAGPGSRRSRRPPAWSASSRPCRRPGPRQAPPRSRR